MPQSPNYVDGSIEYGGSLLTITPKTSASPTRSILTTFTAATDAQFEFSTAAKVVDRVDQNGEYSGGFGIPQKRTGSCVIQLPATREAYAGDTFTLDTTGNDFITASTTIFQITSASHVFENEGYRKQTIEYFIRKYQLDNSTLNTPVAA